jgi:hypothetical protein
MLCHHIFVIRIGRTRQCKNNLKEDTVRFRLVQALYKSNNLRPILLYYIVKEFIILDGLWDATYID